MRRIETLDHIAEGLDALCRADERLVNVRQVAGDVPLRLVQPGFASLVSIVVSQQISRASADAIRGRLLKIVDPLTSANLIEAGETAFREAGLSRPKQRTLLAAATAVEEGLDLDALCFLDADEAMARLMMVHGIGRWTAEVYLLFAAGHPDIFPARDVALQSAVGHALRFAARPDEKALSTAAESWAPWRGVAARLFWSYYRTLRGREGLPLG
jgi:DNA-3-methyladenine glycosylase II